MQRPAFNVVTFILVTLCSAGAIVAMTKRFIPPPPANSLKDSSDAFLTQGMYQPIKWQLIGDAPLSQARRENKPIMLVIGTPWSNPARAFDREVFRDPEIANYVGRYFVCIRVDGNEYPEWLNAMLPLTRISAGVQSGFQIWTLDSQARPLRFIGRSEESPTLNATTFYSNLRQSVEEFAELAGQEPPLYSAQTQDFDKLTLNANGRNRLDRSRELPLSTYTSGPSMLIQSAERASVEPGVIRYMLASGRFEEAETVLMGWITSALFDPVNGGWWNSVRGPQLDRLSYDKVTIQNAEMASVLAAVAAARKNPHLAEAARLTFDYIYNVASSGDGIASCQIGDEEQNGRSKSASVGRARLGTLSPGLQKWASENLNLVLGQNSTMVPRLMNAPALLAPELKEIRLQLRKDRTDAPVLATERYLYVEGTVAARTIEAANLLGDAGRLDTALLANDRLREFIVNDVWQRRLSPEPSAEVTLKCQLAYADSELQAFIATGRVVSLNNGLEILKTALNSHRTEVKGVYLNAPKFPGKLQIPKLQVPEVADNIGQSATATAVRLCAAYGIAVGERPLYEASRQMVQHYSDILPVHPLSASMMAVTISSTSDSILVVGGSDAVERCAQLMREDPSRLVFPGIGVVAGAKGTVPAGLFRKSSTGVLTPVR